MIDTRREAVDERSAASPVVDKGEAICAMNNWRVNKRSIHIVAYLLFAVGLVLVLAPIVQGWYYDGQEERALAAAEQAVRQAGELPDDAGAQDAELQLPLQRLNELLDVGYDEEDEGQADGEAAAQPAEPPRPDPIAVLRIDSINLKLPVLPGATQANLKYAAAHMTETTALGEVGNAAIAAHRVKRKGKMFNRLDEVNIGDSIIVETAGKKLEYTVFSTSIVEPGDVSVLYRNGVDSLLTLITCDPIVNPTHRLIVHAKL